MKCNWDRISLLLSVKCNWDRNIMHIRSTKKVQMGLAHTMIWCSDFISCAFWWMWLHYIFMESFSFRFLIILLLFSLPPYKEIILPDILLDWQILWTFSHGIHIIRNMGAWAAGAWKTRGSRLAVTTCWPSSLSFSWLFEFSSSFSLPAETKELALYENWEL